MGLGDLVVFGGSLKPPDLGASGPQTTRTVTSTYLLFAIDRERVVTIAMVLVPSSANHAIIQDDRGSAHLGPWRRCVTDEGYEMLSLLLV